MAFGSDKNNALLAAQAAAQEVEIRMLREQLAEKRDEIKDLKTSLTRTQDALIAKEAPEAYRDHRIEREQAIDENLTPEQQSAIEIKRIEARAAEEFISNMIPANTWKAIKEQHYSEARDQLIGK